MRVLSFSVPDWVDPAAAFEALYAQESHAVWLDSGVHATAGMSVIGSAARRLTASVVDNSVTVDGVVSEGTVFDLLRDDLAGNAVAAGEGFRLGWVGWLGYELRAQTMRVETSRSSRYPDAALVYLDRAVTFDHASRTVTLLALGAKWAGETASWRDSVAAVLARLAGESSTRQAPTASAGTGVGSSPSWSNAGESAEPVPVDWAYTDQQYLAMISECQSAITRGDAYQLCLTTQARVDVRPDPLSTYLALRESSPTHHGAYFRMGQVSLLSASPEQFLAVSPDGAVQTSPIKGTRKRGVTPEEDARLRDELLSSDKERAENLMIVDLMRNDIGRIAQFDSVVVSSLLRVETYAQVHQLVSTVRGRLADGVSGVDAVVSCFPAGSMTGAPKRSATDILDRLEQRPRGIYSGALGYFGLDGRIDLSMVIRSIVLDANGATIGTGGGITALSVPREELDEVHLKAAALLRVLGVPAVR